MDKKKILPIIIILVILLIALIVIFVTIAGNNKDNDNTNNLVENVQTAEETNNFFKQIDDYQTYYTIKNIMSNYTTYVKHITGDEYMDATRLGMSQEEMKSTVQNDGVTAIKAILDPEYISDMQTEDNTIIERQQEFIKKGDYSENIPYNVTFSSALIGELKSNVKLALLKSQINGVEFDILLKLDLTNKTYSIFYEDYIEKYGYDENTQKEAIQVSDSDIQKNDYNSYTEANITDEFLVTQYFAEYKANMLYNTEQAYSLLNETYRNNKFGDYTKFASYVNTNREKFETANIEGYEINEFDGVREYVCIDQYDRYYIFSERNVSSFDVVLDTFTVDLPDFLEEYNKSNNADKAGMNLQKIVDALNDGDYTYIYNKLDETFKQNNFKTENDFTTYMNNTFFANNNVEFSNYRNSGDLHIFDATFTDKDNANSQAVTKTFIVQLREGTDYRMSFNVQ